MRQAIFGWLGTGTLAIAAIGAMGACSSNDTSGSGASSGTGTGTSSGGAGSTTTTGTMSTTSSTGSGVDAGASVLMHHKNPTRDGLYVEPTFSKGSISTLHEDATFAPSGLKGNVYSQPLFVDGGTTGPDMVIVTTETNDVYALDASTGAQLWTKNLGAPVPLGQLPCGNIDPYGITGTPVIDFATRTLYVNAETSTGGVTHQVFALSIDDGSVRSGWPVDVTAKAMSGSTAFSPKPQGQRGGLALVNGTLYVGYGGLYGDCGTYHGWVVAISETDPTNVKAWATDAAAGGVWAPNGISTDGTNLFVATGNTMGTNGTWGGGDAVIRLGTGASFGMNAYFAPKNWFDLDNADLDLGTGPVVFDLPGSTPSTLVIVFGKDGKAYLLDRNNLGSVSDALSTVQVASNEIISAPALYTTATATYVAVKGQGTKCTDSTSGDLLTLKIVPGSPPTLAPSWCGAGGGGSPIVTTIDGHAEAIVWNFGADADGHLHAFDGDTGMPITFTDSNKSIPGIRTYNTPIAAKGKIFVPVDGPKGGVVAFKL